MMKKVSKLAQSYLEEKAGAIKDKEEMEKFAIE